jgi:hypothetical protein
MQTLEFMICLVCLIMATIILGLPLINLNKEFELKNQDILNKTKSNFCASIIDSIYSNNSLTYNNSFECYFQNNQVNYKNKFTKIIPNILDEKNLEIEKNEHYIK